MSKFQINGIVRGGKLRIAASASARALCEDFDATQWLDAHIEEFEDQTGETFAAADYDELLRMLSAGECTNPDNGYEQLTSLEEAAVVEAVISRLSR